MIPMLVMLAVGVLLGFFLGRWTAENGRARSDMRRTWDSRRNYRDG